MREICIDDFLMKCNPNHVERHSESSDFESPSKIPIITSKGGNHRLLSGKTCNTKEEISNCKFRKISEIYNAMDLNVKTDDLISQKNVILTNMNDRMKNVSPKPTNVTKRFTEYNNKNRGDQSSYCLDKVNSKYLGYKNVMPCLSTIFKRRNNCVKNMSSIDEDQTNVPKNYDRSYCVNCERRKVKKFKQHRGYSVQPVYTVEENIQGFKTSNYSTPKVKNISENLCIDVNKDISLSSESELEKANGLNHKKIMKKMKHRYKKEKEVDCSKYNSIKNQQQQYPSKFQLKPYQVFTSSSCQAKCSTSESEGLVKMPSSSSAFWDFFAQKMKNKIQKQGISKSCDCIKPPEPCSPDNCEYLNKVPVNPDYYSIKNQIPNRNSCCQQTDQDSSQSSTSSKKKIKEPKIICKCYSRKKRDGESKITPLVVQKDETKPCQEDHDDITRAISEKYNGEIICIHNPPCILINGCLNLPPPKTNIQANLWPVTQSKKSSFVQMCRKIKRSKQRNEQASQYYPPFTDLQEFLPEFKTEKIIQSICNHDPPCEIVHGCYKARYDPKLQTSCVHVPMCENLPACLLSDNKKEIPQRSCYHNPKCAKLPICSRKYITLTAKEHVGTQVRAKPKMVCRHQPQCFMIPKCLMQAITGDYIPYGAIPGCVHHPCCELIPACCRKSSKEMISVPSQNPNACRIV